MIAKGVTLNIGRTAGANEAAKKALVSARGGHRDPDRAGFWEMTVAADAVAKAVAFANARPKHGRLLKGAPDDVWARDIAEAPLAALDAEHLHVFMPEARETVVRSGSVFATVGGKLMAWREPELLAALGSGYAVVIKFEPAEPGLGAAIFNREGQNTSRNRWGWPVGEFLGLAEFEPEAPQIMARGVELPEAEQESLDRRKRYLSAVRAEYRGIFPHGRKPSVAREARNGRGEIVRIESTRGQDDRVTRGQDDKVARGHGERMAVTPAPGHPDTPSSPAPAPAWRDPIMAQIFGG